MWRASSGWTQASGSTPAESCFLETPSVSQLKFLFCQVITLWRGWNQPRCQKAIICTLGLACCRNWNFQAFFLTQFSATAFHHPPPGTGPCRSQLEKIQLCTQVTEGLPYGSTPVDTEYATAFPEFTLSDLNQFNSTNVYWALTLYQALMQFGYI